MSRERSSRVQTPRNIENRGIISKENLIKRGWEIAFKKGIGKHPELITGMPGQTLMVDSGIPLKIKDDIVTGPAGAEAHEDMRDVIHVHEGTLVLVLGDILDPEILIDKEGDAIATETRGSRMLVKEVRFVQAGESTTVEPGVGHIHGSLDEESTVIATFLKQEIF